MLFIPVAEKERVGKIRENIFESGQNFRTRPSHIVTYYFLGLTQLNYIKKKAVNVRFFLANLVL